MRTGHLFAGAGGGLYADLILGHKPIFAVEWDAYACGVLRSRAEDGWFPGLRVHEGDVRLFDASEYTGKVDCLHAGFPCQDIAAAGSKKGIEGERSGLYREVLRVSSIVRPKYLFFENSADITFSGLDRVLSDIAAMGYDAKWCCLGSIDTGGCHFRKRWWMLAYPSKNGSDCICWRTNKELRNMEIDKTPKPPVNWILEKLDGQRAKWEANRCKSENCLPPYLCRIDDEMAYNVNRLECLGNGQDPITAAAAWKILGGP